MEYAIADIAKEHSRQRSSDTVFNFVESRIKRPVNMNAERVLQIVGAFDTGWRNNVEEFISGERKAALDSVVANRNSIAHGDSVGLTYHRIRVYFDRICEVVEFIEDLFR